MPDWWLNSNSASTTAVPITTPLGTASWGGGFIQTYVPYNVPTHRLEYRLPADIVDQARAARDALTPNFAEARERARALLRDVLTAEQWRMYEEAHYIPLRGSRGRHWRVRQMGHVGNVLLVTPDGEPAATFCGHLPDDIVPDADHHLAQVLALTTDEDAFIAAANLHWVHGDYYNQALEAVAA